MNTQTSLFLCIVVAVSMVIACQRSVATLDKQFPLNWKYESINYNMFGVPFDTTVYTVEVDQQQQVGDTLISRLSDSNLIAVIDGRITYRTEFDKKIYPVYDSKVVEAMAPKMVVTLDNDTTIYDLVIQKTGTAVVDGDEIYEFTTPRTLSRDGSSFYQKRVVELSNTEGIVSLTYYDERDSITNYTRLVTSSR